MSAQPLDRLKELLEDFKSARPGLAAEELSEDDRRVAFAWERLPAVVRNPLFLGGAPEHRPNRWKYLWTFRVVDGKALAQEAGLSEEACQNAFDRLKAAYWIFPDGTARTLDTDGTGMGHNPVGGK